MSLDGSMNSENGPKSTSRIHSSNGLSGDRAIHDSGKSRTQNASSDNGTFPEDEWPPTRLGTTGYIAWFRAFDWASTTLGPTKTWPKQLKQVCEMMLANPEPMTIFWGSGLILIYNEAYVELAGNKHPAMLGGTARVHWAEVWDQYEPLFNQMRIDGKAFKQDNTQLFIHRNGYLEEGFFNLCVMPLLADDGSVVGFWEPVAEVTKQTLAERRMHTLLKLSKCTSSATSLTDLWRLSLEAMSDQLNDIHCLGLYSLDHESQSSEPRYILEGTVGLGGDMSGLRPKIHLGSDEGGIVPSFKRALETGTVQVLTVADGTLSPTIIQRLESVGVAEKLRTCVTYPLCVGGDGGVEAFLVIGISPRRPYDEDYKLFINLLARQIESAIISVRLFEKEKERARQQAIFESEVKFKRFAENAQVGIFSFDPAGNITFCNEAWLELSGHDRNDMSAMSWTNDVHPENIEEIKQYWTKIANLEGPQTFEVQYRKPWKPANIGDASFSLDRTWVVASAYAEANEYGELTGILGCVTDISSLKWVDRLQSQRLDEAIELKRQQENFLDITSHEMRNPLNAILHCATELTELLPELSNSNATVDRASNIKECLEASRTIAYCGRHQKRIIDDVLTLSKLDSNLLSICPVETRPLSVVEEVLRVFDTEIRASSIQAKTELAESYKTLNIESVLVDSHRLIQILINLVANAIKFTKGESLRDLRIVLAAYLVEPASSDSGVRYVPSGRHRTDPTKQPDWGTGETVFLHFSVRDTGPGMSREEANHLFNRFAQASPRTHVQYGGSGLGLFISRELAELHGGRIGISSELGLGSTFDFYVKGRRPGTSGASRRPSEHVADEHTAPVDLASDRSRQLDVTSTVRQSGLHVLIVEDNLVNQKILAKLLRKHGYNVSITNHGEEALATIHRSKWRRRPLNQPSTDLVLELDIVLADIEMPIMDGKEFVQHVRQQQVEGLLSKDIPIIAVTGNARNEQIQQARDCGFDEVVRKPYRIEDIISMIKVYTSSKIQQ